MHWLVTYRARWHHAWRERTEKGVGEVRVHTAKPFDCHAIIDVDPDAWVRDVRTRLGAMLEDPQDETAFIELLEIYSIEPLDEEARVSGRDLREVFGMMGGAPLRLAH
jgi:hypothetical protein